ncbi:MAG: hypothetical protein D6773_06380 [Alphaproteobacteria bacterium]|nr:MAG: hypothetical protein D6773_06380 [Alphaproteobacteria bacterium]
MYPYIHSPFLSALAASTSGWLRVVWHAGAALALAALALAPAFAAAEEDAWQPLKGNWRTTEIASCGIDDVRAGRILSVGENSIRHGFILCVIREGAREGDAIRLVAQCDLGGGYETPLEYEFRLTGPHEATLSLYGQEKRLVRCVKGIE